MRTDDLLSCKTCEVTFPEDYLVQHVENVHVRSSHEELISLECIECPYKTTGAHKRTLVKHSLMTGHTITNVRTKWNSFITEEYRRLLEVLRVSYQIHKESKPPQTPKEILRKRYKPSTGTGEQTEEGDASSNFDASSLPATSSRTSHEIPESEKNPKVHLEPILSSVAVLGNSEIPVAANCEVVLGGETKTDSKLIPVAPPLILGGYSGDFGSKAAIGSDKLLASKRPTDPLDAERDSAFIETDLTEEDQTSPAYPRLNESDATSLAGSSAMPLLVPNEKIPMDDDVDVTELEDLKWKTEIIEPTKSEMEIVLGGQANSHPSLSNADNAMVLNDRINIGRQRRTVRKRNFASKSTSGFKRNRTYRFENSRKNSFLSGNHLNVKTEKNFSDPIKSEKFHHSAIKESEFGGSYRVDIFENSAAETTKEFDSDDELLNTDIKPDVCPSDGPLKLRSEGYADEYKECQICFKKLKVSPKNVNDRNGLITAVGHVVMHDDSLQDYNCSNCGEKFAKKIHFKAHRITRKGVAGGCNEPSAKCLASGDGSFAAKTIYSLLKKAFPQVEFKVMKGLSILGYRQ